MEKIQPIVGMRRLVIGIVAAEFGFRRSDMIGFSRSRDVCRARNVAMFILRGRGFSCSHIAEALGRRDHTTIIHGSRSIRDVVGRDPALAEIIARIQQRIAGDPLVPETSTTTRLPKTTRVSYTVLAPQHCEREALKLRKGGWSFNSIARRYGLTCDQAAALVGEPTMEFAHD